MQHLGYKYYQYPLRFLNTATRQASYSYRHYSVDINDKNSLKSNWYQNGFERPLLGDSNDFKRRNIFLMGPPGSGKTTVGRELAQLMNKPLIDIDDNWLEPRWKTSVAAKLSELGDEQFLEAEGYELLALNHRSHIISLTGSNPLHTKSMKHLAHLGIFVYLDASRESILNRCEIMRVDRIVGQRTKTLNEILAWREHIYEKSYDIRIIIGQCESQKDIAKKLLNQLEQQPNYYESTRSEYSEKKQQFLDVVRQGIAPDGGLFVSRSFSRFTLEELERFIGLSYPELALRVMERFPLGTLHPSHLRSLLWQAYSTFNGSILPVRHLQKHQYLMETFHGPTGSFKDLSLQILPHLMQASTELNSKGNMIKKRLGLLIATSGDTGCAALDGFSRLPGTPVIVLYPKSGVSTIQQVQMQTASDNVCVLGVDADFDFCQTTVKELLNDENFLSDIHQIIPDLHMSSANSINWARLLPQVVFTISSYLQLIEQGVIKLGEPIDICIPTGNFGNILGAIFARQLGLPVRRLIAASNENNVITDFIQTGSYDLRHRQFKKTISPSIDILVSSNLERFIYLLSNGNHSMIRQLFERLKHDRYFNIDSNLLKHVQSEIEGGWTNEHQCMETIKNVYRETQQLIDPHTAVAVHVAEKLSRSQDTVPMLISATAHYAKFPQTILKSIGDNKSLSLPSSHDTTSLLKDLQSLKSITPMHIELMKLSNKPIKHLNTIDAKKTAIVKEIKAYLERFSKNKL